SPFCLDRFMCPTCVTGLRRGEWRSRLWSLADQPIHMCPIPETADPRLPEDGKGSDRHAARLEHGLTGRQIKDQVQLLGPGQLLFYLKCLKRRLIARPLVFHARPVT
ncbi:MAG: hypothetical protein ACREI3_03165, partial [Nitrospirales bacterium]